MFFTDASSLYTEKLLFENVTGVWIYINYIIILLSPIYWIYTILSMLLWRNLNNFKKIGSLFIYLLWILQYICTATNVGLFNFFIIFVICYISRDFLESKESKINYKKYVFYLGCLAVLLCVIFSITMGSRIGDNYDASYSYITNRNVNIDQNSILWICTPNVLKPLLCYF